MSRKRQIKIKYPVSKQYLETAYHIEKLGVKDVVIYEEHEDFYWIQTDSGARYTVPKDWLKEIKRPMNAEDVWQSHLHYASLFDDEITRSDFFKIWYLCEENERLKHEPKQTSQEIWESFDPDEYFDSPLSYSDFCKILNLSELNRGYNN